LSVSGYEPGQEVSGYEPGQEGCEPCSQGSYHRERTKVARVWGGGETEVTEVERRDPPQVHVQKAFAGGDPRSVAHILRKKARLNTLSCLALGHREEVACRESRALSAWGQVVPTCNPNNGNCSSHARPFVGVSQVRSWSHWCAFVNIWRALPTFSENSIKIDFRIPPRRALRELRAYPARPGF